MRNKVLTIVSKHLFTKYISQGKKNVFTMETPGIYHRDKHQSWYNGNQDRVIGSKEKRPRYLCEISAKDALT